MHCTVERHCDIHCLCSVGLLLQPVNPILQKDLRLNPQVKIYMIVILIIDIYMDTNLQKDAHVTTLGYVTAPHCYM